VNITAVKESKTSVTDDPDVIASETAVAADEDTDDRDTDSQESDDRDVDVTRKDSTSLEGRRISVSVRGLSLGVLVIALVAAVAVMTWLYTGADRKIDAQAQQTLDNQHAEQVALDYAVRAAIMDSKDLGPWKRALVDGTTPELSKKLTDAANAMEQILLPLQWSSTAKPIAAKVRSHDNGVYVVDSFVSVMTKTIQAPQDLQSTATYSVKINPGDGWKISDVGGIGQVVGDK
jgi:Mce-associated membrane protein